MAKTGYSLLVPSPSAVALVAGTAKTVLYVLAPSQFGVDLIGARVSFDGVLASDVPALCEIVRGTAATNSTPGTGSTTATPVQNYGQSITPGFTGAYNCTSEPTVLSALDLLKLTPNGGAYVYDFSLGQSIECAPGQLIGLRITAITNAVNCFPVLKFERS